MASDVERLSHTEVLQNYENIAYIFIFVSFTDPNVFALDMK